ncbi:quinone oxidoreductase family protein [Actinoplanes sp. HUAS TT8]|uniref:quinone oxidoreductase family protein n=1 Tax=Actinoplanes sp. HUAS TT8 TaxID=3447453 RepID=UPI003F51D59D
MISAAVLTTCGQAPVIEQRPAPVPARGELLVDVVAVPITPLDLLCASGVSYFGTPSTPYVPGVQGVGRLADGSPVWFATAAGMRPGDGSMASVVAVPAADVVRLPIDVRLNWHLISALGLSAVAAHGALHRAGGLAEGEQVVVLGAGGVVGQAAVQLAKLGGARRVVAVARSERSLARAAELGADATVRLTPDGFEERLRAATDGPADLVVDPIFGAPAAAALRVLRPDGRLVNLGSSAGPTAPIDSATLRGGSLQVIGYTNNALPVEVRAAVLTEIAEHAAAGRLTVDHESVPFADVTSAWERQAADQGKGRIVLVLP